MANRRTETWLLVIVAAAALIPVAIGGLWVYMVSTARPLHPDMDRVPSVTHSTLLPEWASAAEEGRQIVRAVLADQNVPGMSVAVGVDGDIVWAEGFGWADLENRRPVVPETRFRIGTASIALTSAAVGLLLERGRLNLDDEVQIYVPAFPEKEWPVTVRQLMGHVAGVRNDGGDEGPLLSASCDRPVEGLESFAERPLLFEPGAQYHFSSYGWIVVSAAVEAAAGEPFTTFMRTEIFEPLHMLDTEPDSAREAIRHRAISYFPRFASDPRWGLHLMRPVDYSCYAGASAFLSTASDLVRFGIAINDGRLLRPATVQSLQTAQHLSSGEETGYGLGWELGTVTLAGEPSRWAGHDGSTLGGRVASLMTFPESGIVVAAISNISYADTDGVAARIAQAFAE